MIYVDLKRKREYKKKYDQKPEVKVKRRKYEKEYYGRLDIKVRRKEYLKEYNQRPEVKVRRKEYMKLYSQKPEVKARKSEYMKQYNQRYQVKVRRKEYEKENKERIQKRQKKYMKKYMNGYIKDRRKNDADYALGLRLRTSLNDALKKYTKTGKVMSSKKYGINYKEIIEHLKPFPKDIENYHVDHIVPLCNFDLNNPEEVKKAFYKNNLQWLTIEENRKKGSRII